MNVHSIKVLVSVMLQKRSDKKEIILNATLATIAKYGLNASMSKIVKKSGVSTGVFYHYFKCKESMIGELYKKVKLEFLEASVHNFNEQLPYRERFRILWFNAVNFFIENPNILILFGQFENAPHLLPKLDSAHYNKLEIFEHYVNRGIEDGVLKDLPFKVITDLSVGLGMQVVKDAMDGMIVLEKDMLNRIENACWDAVKK